MSFESYKAAKAQVDAWKLQFPAARFRIEQFALGNNVRWQIVQTNRFAS